jgi:hypothetical protein
MFRIAVIINIRLNLDSLEILVIEFHPCKDGFFMSRYTLISPATTPATSGVVGFPYRSAPV